MTTTPADVPVVESVVELELPDLTATGRLGERIGAALGAGDVVVLDGALGAGKTALTKAIATGMGVRGTITSPTIVIARVHEGEGVPLVHVDAYRLEGAVELDDLDLATDLTRAAVVVEWGRGVADHLAEAPLTVQLTRHPDDSRTAAVSGDRARWGALLDALRG